MWLLKMLPLFFMGLCCFFAFSSVALDVFAPAGITQRTIIQKGIARLCLVATIPSVVLCIIFQAVLEIFFK
jgi:hypothetical protein